jgi:cytochrome P450
MDLPDIPALKTPGGIATILLALIAFWYFTTALIAWSRLRHIPGPWFAGFSYMWVGWTEYSGKQHQVFSGLEKKYGSLVRISPEVLVTSDVEVVKRMSGRKSAYRKSTWVDGVRLNPYNETMFMVRDPHEHDQVKARLAPAYSGRDTPHLEDAVDQQVNNLLALIRRRYLSDPASGEFRVMSLIDVSSYFALDVISKVALGTEFGCCASDSDPYKFYEAVAEHMPFMAVASDIPWIRAILYSPTFLKYFGPKETDTHGVGPLMKVTNDVVRAHYSQEQDEKKNILSSFKAHGLPEGDAQSEALFMFVAGSDTTAAAIRVTMFYIMSSPRVYQKLKKEIRKAINEGQASSPITLAQARELPYLQAVIYEGLRIRPVTTGQQAKEVPPGGDTINGYFVPEGTSIATNFSAILGSRELFGPDADIFRPERFIGLQNADLAEMRRNVEMNFGYGRWMCAGKPIALMELHKVYFELLRAFDFQLIEPLKPMTSESYALFRDHGLKVRVTVAEDME